MLALSFRYLYKAYIMYFLDIYSKAAMYNEIYYITFPKQSEIQNLENFGHLYFAIFPRFLRSLAVLLDKCLLTDVFLFYKIVCCL